MTIDSFSNLDAINAEIVNCRRCPRLVQWREKVAHEKRAAYADQDYWGRPITGFGDREGRLLILGLAPGAHGANRTGRIFTGDRSGDFLFSSLYRTGFANQPTAIACHDGLKLTDCFVTAAVRCAPPQNKPTPQEQAACLNWLKLEFAQLKRVETIVCLGGFAWRSALTLLSNYEQIPRPIPRFGHASEATIGPYRLLGCYHPSQQNTFTGRLTPQMIDAVVASALT